MIILYLSLAYSLQYMMKIKGTYDYISITPESMLTVGSLNNGIKLKITNFGPNPREKIFKDISSQKVFDTEAQSRKVLAYKEHGNENQRYELITQDFDNKIYMIAQACRCLEWCGSCGFFMMNMCNMDNPNMLFEIVVYNAIVPDCESRPPTTPESAIEQFDPPQNCMACQLTQQPRCYPCENPPQNTCFSCNAIQQSPPCPCTMNRGSGPYW